jgi:hypothetical protein
MSFDRHPDEAGGKPTIYRRDPLRRIEIKEFVGSIKRKLVTRGLWTTRVHECGFERSKFSKFRIRSDLHRGLRSAKPHAETPPNCQSGDYERVNEYVRASTFLRFLVHVRV